MATHLASRLAGEGLTVDVLYTVDAAAGPESSLVNRNISCNVKANMNFYQTTPSLLRSRGAENTSYSRNTRVYNVLQTVSNHGNIDEFTEKAIVNSMIRILNMVNK